MRYSERWRNRNDSDRDLNLAPFMNIVAILIPMLLLSVVFLKVGVIDVSTPSIVPEDQSDDTAPEDRLRLTVAISKSGFEIASADETFAPIEGCPKQGPTICLADPEVDIDEQFRRARPDTHSDGARSGSAEAALDAAVAAYDFASLYNRLRRLKSNHPTDSKVRLTASPDVPYRLVVRVMDAIRYERPEQRYANNEEFWRASPDSSGAERSVLFSRPILAIGK